MSFIIIFTVHFPFPLFLSLSHFCLILVCIISLAGHAWGTDSPERKEAMKDFDEILTKLQDEIETRGLEQEVSLEFTLPLVFCMDTIAQRKSDRLTLFCLFLTLFLLDHSHRARCPLCIRQINFFSRLDLTVTTCTFCATLSCCEKV